MQTGNDGDALSAAQGPELEALLTDDLADVVGLLASVALEPPRTPARSAAAARPCLWPLTQWDLRRCVYGWFEAMRLDRPRPRHGGMQAPGPGGLGGLRQVDIESQLGGGTGRGQRVVGEGGLGDTGDGRERHRPSCGE